MAGDYGISLLPHTAQALGQQGVHFRRIAEALPTVQALVIHRADRALSPAARTLNDVLLNAYAEPTPAVAR